MERRETEEDEVNFDQDFVTEVMNQINLPGNHIEV